MGRLTLRSRIRTALAAGPRTPEDVAAALQVPVEDVRATIAVMRSEKQVVRLVALAPPKPRVRSKPVPFERRPPLAEEVIAAIAASSEPSSVVARRFRVSRQTVWKYRRRA